MTHPEDRQSQSLLHEVIENPESLSKEELETISGGVPTKIVPQVLRRSLSDSDLPRLAREYPDGIFHTPPPSPSSHSGASSSSGDVGRWASPDRHEDRYIKRPRLQ